MQRLLTARFPRWTTLPARHPRRWLAAISMIVACALYAATTAPGIVTFFDDSLEFQTVAPTFAIAHPTGYPLYTLTGGVWTRLLPVGTWAGRMNLFSALSAALAVGLLAALAAQVARRRDGSPDLWAGAAAAIAFGLGPVWWSQATVAEVYTLHVALVAAILLVTVDLPRALDPDGRPTIAFDRRVTGLALLFGLGLAHHRTTVLVALPVLLYLLTGVPQFWRPRRAWGRWLAALLAPLLLYLYLPLRAAAGAVDLHGSYTNTWPGFWDHVLARGYTAFFADNPLAVTRSLGEWASFVVEQTGWIALIVALVGLIRLVDRRAQASAWWLVLLILSCTVIFVAFYRVPDPEVFLLPAFLCLAVLTGGGVSLLSDLANSRALPSPNRGGWITPPLLKTLLLTALVLLPTGRGAALNRADDWTRHDQARLMAAVDFPPASRILGIEGEMTAIRYMQVAEGLARHAQPIAADNPARRLALLEEAIAAGVPVYLTRELADIGSRYSFSGEGALVRVWPRGQAVVEPLPAVPPHALLDGALSITGYTARRTTVTAQPTVELTLDWRVHAPTDRVLKLSLRAHHVDGAPLLDAQGSPVVADLFPLRQVALTPDWPSGELIRDVHYLALPAGAATGPLRLRVIIYDGETAHEIDRIEIMF